MRSKKCDIKYRPDNPSILFKEFEKLCNKIDMRGSILEIGSGGSPETLLNMRCVRKSKFKIGINLTPFDYYADFKVIKGNANDMREIFKNNTFDVVLCNAIFEHDKYFWKSLSEIRRVIKPRGVFVLGVPGIVLNSSECKHVSPHVAQMEKEIEKIDWATTTIKVHGKPNDYYRFTSYAYREVLMEGFIDIVCTPILLPPRLIGCGIRQ